MKQTITLYLCTLIVLTLLDFLFLGAIAKPIFYGAVGDMLADSARALPAILFYVIYALGILLFVNGAPGKNAATACKGALFGFFCYMTFELTSLAILKHWEWNVAFLDMAWGATVTAISAAAGRFFTNLICRERTH